MNKFGEQVEAFRVKALGNIDLVVQGLARFGVTGLMERSPVLTGQFRASWRVSADVPDLTVAPKRAHDFHNSIPIGNVDTGALAFANAIISTLKAGGVVHISNDMPQGPALEGGSSDQAERPAMIGPVQLTILEEAYRIARSLP